MAIKLITFAAGSGVDSSAIERFRYQAKKFNIFEIIVVDKHHLYYKAFIDMYYDFLKENQRGFGYWLWKPFIIKMVLEDSEPDDVIIYADVGCELSSLGKSRLLNYIKCLNRQPLLAFKVRNSDPEVQWTKRELIKLLNPEFHCLDSPQIAATFIYFKKCEEASIFVDDWLRISTIDSCFYITDDYYLMQSEDFIEHRHDQSIFSLLYKNHGFYFSSDENQFDDTEYFSGAHSLTYPIHSLRHKNGEYWITDSLIAKKNRESYLKFWLKRKLRRVISKIR